MTATGAERWSGGGAWIAVKLMRPWKDLAIERVCLVITVKRRVTNYHVQPANEHRLPDHAAYSITGERDEERASRREEREEPGSFSPSMTFRLMRPRRAGYFLNLTGRRPYALRDFCFPLSSPRLTCRWGSKQHGVNTCVRRRGRRKCSLLKLHWLTLHNCLCLFQSVMHIKRDILCVYSLIL